MKNRIVAAFLTMMMAAGVFAGCGSTKTESLAESSSLVAASSTEEEDTDLPVIDDAEKEFVVSDYVTIGDCKGMELEEIESYEITDEDVESYAEELKGVTEVTEEDAEVEDGDVVNIDYVGTMDGEEFDGGSSEGYDLTIGSDTFIDGFEEGLIGAKKGEEVTLHLTFPEDYSEDLGGKDVDFAVTINSISRMEGELTEEDLAEAREELEEAYEEYEKQIYETDIWSNLVDSADFKAYPKSYIEFFSDDYVENQIGAADEDAIEEYKTENSLDDAAYEQEVYEYAVSLSQQALIIDALQEQLGITEDSDAYKAVIADLVEQMGEESEETLKENYYEINVRLYTVQTLAFEEILKDATYVKSGE